MIKFRSLALAFHRAIKIREALEREALDADSSRIAAKADREEQLKQERLDFLAAQFAIID